MPLPINIEELLRGRAVEDGKGYAIGNFAGEMN